MSQEFQTIFEELFAEGNEINPDSAKAAAAMLGPGYRGECMDVPDEQRIELAKKLLSTFETIGANAPAYLTELAEGKTPNWSDRRAKLFEIGEYEDKGLFVHEHHLEKLSTAFSFPVPVLIEHTENPLRLGYLTQVEAAGGELFGNLALTNEANRLVEESGAHRLSLSVSPNLDEIYEVSIVANPRIESARLFCGNFQPNQTSDLQRENAELKASFHAQRIESAVENLLRERRIVPAAKEAAKNLLFSAAKKGVEAEVLQFLNALPMHRLCEEMAPANLDLPEATADEVDFYTRHFPDIGMKEILKRKVAR